LLINLGDIIDGKCAAAEHGEKAIDNVLEALSEYTHGRILHTYGNHELYVHGREEIFQKLNIPFVIEDTTSELVGYYSFVTNKIRFIVLDSYDIALMGRCPETSLKRREAVQWLSVNNPKYPNEENSPKGLNGLKKRFVAFNGAVGTVQVQWLQETLRTENSNYERVIVLSHQPILPGSSSPLCLMWNFNDVLRVLRQYRCTIMASFAGHAHRGGYARDEQSGIHFRVFESVLETPRPYMTYGFVDIHEDFMQVRGIGECISAVYDFSHMAQASVRE
jgi:manganese-dependent ADP-ribose/CDP-alcohol diphosphatase